MEELPNINVCSCDPEYYSLCSRNTHFSGTEQSIISINIFAWNIVSESGIDEHLSYAQYLDILLTRRMEIVISPSSDGCETLKAEQSSAICIIIIF